MINTHPTHCNICGGRVTYGSNARVYGREYGAGIAISASPVEPMWERISPAHKRRLDFSLTNQ